jgi:hypothetical protein
VQNFGLIFAYGGVLVRTDVYRCQSPVGILMVYYSNRLIFEEVLDMVGCGVVYISPKAS